MKVTLISPYLEIYCIGLRTISALLKKEGFQVDFLFLPQNFLQRFSPENLEDIASFCEGSDLISLSVMSNQMGRVIQITNKLKKKSGPPIVWGGIHPTTSPEESLQYADAVCIGEGEEAFLDLARSIRDKKDFFTTKGFWFKRDDKIIKNEIGPLISDLDSLPYPDYDYERQYLLDDGKIQPFNESYFIKHLSTIYLTLGSRGCPYSCAYCCNDAFKKIYKHNSQLYRRRSLDHLLGELKMIKERFPFIKRILFEDDLFLATSDENIEKFCSEYKKTIDIPFTVAGITPSTINEKRLLMLLDAGMCYIRMGIQTASLRLSKVFNRPFNPEKTRETILLLNKYKKRVHHPYYDLILDTPWETVDDRIETLEYLWSIPKPYKMNLFSMTFYPGTALYEKARAEGLINDPMNDIYDKNYTFLEHTYANALFYIIYNTPWMPQKMLRILINKKLILSLDKYEISGKIIFLLAKAQYLLIEALKDICAGKFWRIARFFEIRKR